MVILLRMILERGYVLRVGSYSCRINLSALVINYLGRIYPQRHQSTAVTHAQRLPVGLPRSHLRFSPTRQNPKPVPT